MRRTIIAIPQHIYTGDYRFISSLYRDNLKTKTIFAAWIHFIDF